MRRPFDTDRVIQDLARTQHGAVNSGQLAAAGVHRSAIQRRVRAGLLGRVHHGVYVVGPVPPPWSREMAAVLACPGGAWISHATAAALWKAWPAQPDSDPIDVITRDSDYGRHRHVRTHRMRTLHTTETTTLLGIPITTIERTLMDLAGGCSFRELERALAEAYARKLTRAAAILRVLDRHVGGPGVRRLLELVKAGEPAFTRSEGEEQFLGNVRRFGLPRPRVNARVGRAEVDFYWPEYRFAVEVDGYAFHSSARSFESDRRRDSELAARGILVMRLTWNQVTRDTDRTMARLALALGARSA